MDQKTFFKDLVRQLREDSHDNKGNNFKLPTTHIPGMQVPKGGSSCSNCKYLGTDGDSCENQYFQAWNYGNTKLPAPADEYCSDWWEPKSGTGEVEASTPQASTSTASPLPAPGKKVVHLKVPKV